MRSRYAPQVFAASLIALMLVTLTVASAAEVRTFRKEIRQVMGSAMSQDDARITAVARAKREALEEAGTYLESFSVVRNFKLERDQVLALSSGVLKVEIVKEEPFLEAGVFGTVVVAQVQVDAAVLDERIRKLLADREHLARLNAVEKRERGLLDRIKKLEAENVRLTKSGGAATSQRIQALQGQISDIPARLAALEWVRKGLALWNGKAFESADQARAYFDEAIARDPGFALAYVLRGSAYAEKKQYERAFADYKQALSIDPNKAVAYVVRGRTYDRLGRHEEAIADFDQALRLNPNDAFGYYARADASFHLKQYERAISDLTNAIRLQPDEADSYRYRGAVYQRVGKNEEAIADYDRAIYLDPKNPFSYWFRGVALSVLKRYEPAIADYDRALRLDPTNAKVYNRRGAVNEALGNLPAACRDWRRAAEIGDATAKSLVKDMCATAENAPRRAPPAPHGG